MHSTSKEYKHEPWHKDCTAILDRFDGILINGPRQCGQTAFINNYIADQIKINSGQRISTKIIQLNHNKHYGQFVTKMLSDITRAKEIPFNMSMITDTRNMETMKVSVKGMEFVIFHIELNSTNTPALIQIMEYANELRMLGVKVKVILSYWSYNQTVSMVKTGLLESMTGIRTPNYNIDLTGFVHDNVMNGIKDSLKYMVDLRQIIP